MTLPRVVVLFNQPCDDQPSDSHRFRESESGVEAEARAVESALSSLGIPFRTCPVRRVEDLPPALSQGSEPIVINLIEALGGRDEDACLVPAICRGMGREVTGNTTSCLFLTFDKGMTKALLQSNGIRTPWWQVVRPGEAIPDFPSEAFPVIVKPLRSDASEGIDARSVVGSPGREVDLQIARIHKISGDAALVESYIEGREFNVSIFESQGFPTVLPLAEIRFVDFPPDRPRIVDYTAKWREDSFEFRNTVRSIPAEVTEREAEQICKTALRVWRLCGCRDYGRIDFRLSEDGALYLLEVNANPDIAPEAGFAAGLDAAGVAYSGFVKTLVENACSRARIGTEVPSVLAGTASEIERTAADQIATIVAFVEATGFFRPDEVAVAAEVLEDAVRRGGYESFTYCSEGKPAGWVCFGPTPCTLGTFDIYWLAVAPSHQGRGVGKRLMAFAEERIAESGGRLAVVETAGRVSYEPTRRFYERIGYALETRILDFYGPGDDKIIYTKRFTRGSS